MRKFVSRGLVATLVWVGLVGVAAPSEAVASYCVGTSSSGRCYTTTKKVTNVTVVEEVPLVNRTTKTGTFHCAFTKTISKEYRATNTAGVEVTGSIKAGIFGGVDVAVSASVETSLSQTGSQATEAGASFTLKPKQKVICQRIYSQVNAQVEEYWYSGVKSGKRYYKAAVPSTFGIRVVD